MSETTTAAPTPPQKKRAGVGRWIARILIALLVLVVLLIAVIIAALIALAVSRLAIEADAVRVETTSEVVPDPVAALA